MTYIVTVCAVMVYIVMACILMAYIIMTCILKTGQLPPGDTQPRSHSMSQSGNQPRLAAARLAGTTHRP